MCDQNTKIVLQFIEGMGSNNTPMAAECLADDAYADAKGFGKLSGKREARSQTHYQRLRGAQMASISDENGLGKATSLPSGHFRPICSPFGRLEGAGNEFVT